MLCERCNQQPAKVRWVRLCGWPLQEHIQQLCRSCFTKATTETVDVLQIPASSVKDRAGKKVSKSAKTRNSKREAVRGLDGCYIQVGHTAVRLVLKDGNYQWGGRDIHDAGTFTADQLDEYSCEVAFKSELFGKTKRCRFARRGRTFTVQELPNGMISKFKRDDDKVFLAETPRGRSFEQTAPPTATAGKVWKAVNWPSAKVSYHLTGESAITAATFPAPPRSKSPTVIRITHSNTYGKVDSEVHVRLGDPARPSGPEDFDSASDWRRAELVEDLLWDNRREKWVLARQAKGNTSVWSGTYEAQLQFPKGHHQIELKIISRVPEVRSVVLSNWKVYVR